MIVAAEAHEQESELPLGAQKKTRGEPAKNLRGPDLRVTFDV
jgi:hypothetical protein